MLSAVSLALVFLTDDDTVWLGMYRLFGTPTAPESYSPYDTISEDAGIWLIVTGALLLFAGTASLRVRCGKQTGALGKASLLVSIGGSGRAYVLCGRGAVVGA